MKVVALGGGTGLSTLLKGLKYFSGVEITAVVTVTDEGGSSGVIREEMGILPPGDIRNNVVALAEDESLMAKIMSYRFKEGQTFKDHSLGNLIIAALTRITGSFAKAIEKISDTLAIKGTVLPVTEESVRLVAEMEDGEIVIGETAISSSKKRIKKLHLDRDAKAYTKVIEAIEKCDIVVLGPGSLYTSVLPNLLVKGVCEVVREKPTILVANLMTQPGETDGFTLEDHVRVVEDYLGRELDKIIVNVQEIPSDVLKRYKTQGAQPVRFNVVTSRMVSANIVKLEVDERDGKEKVRHDPVKLAEIVQKTAKELTGE